MRGNHSRYIDQVNDMQPPWYRKSGKGGHVTSLHDMTYYLPDGRYMIAGGTESDLFSCVPDTGYVEFHKSAFLHDHQRTNRAISRQTADWNFAWDMIKRIEHIRRCLQVTDCPHKVIERETIRLTRLASLYSIGVSGLIGSAYIKLDKWF